MSVHDKPGARVAPIVSGAADLRYLDQALARAGVRGSIATELSTDMLNGGRTGASVTRLTTLAADGERRSFVLKILMEPSPSADAIARATRVIAEAIALARRIQDRHVR